MTSSTTTRLKKATVATALFGTLLSASACGQSLDQAKAGAPGQPAQDSALPAQDTALADLLPKSIKDKGTINVAAAVYAPAVMVPPGGGAPTGWDIQITREAAALLGLKVNFVIIPFDGVIPGLQAGRYDAATGEINVTDERKKSVTFVVNHVSRDAVMVPASSSKTSFASPSDVCGLTIGAALGSSEAAYAEELAAKCNAGGGAATTVKTFATQATVNLALSQGRIDANLASGSQVAYSVDQSKGKFKLLDLPFAPQIKTGLALPRNADTKAMAKAFEAATNKLIQTGRLKKILDDLNGGLGAVDKSEITPEPVS
ncbi:MAG TPA: transporter substrate-binding domain-containing protein [Intrasporangium sp.]|uniref:transporter substrate-binding domain-containing protein n=1 Tax=Intrasporangium sp. TaxID=1925024 RepID=UPI002D7750E1|nr:transporter substrate-binding domain-containing protein [Intrasporangium sp.]HET7398563.1 transporter substrate-binding domain-containing protein [Intrasporangium sp.]